jgi:hypothetical protein
MHVFCLTKKADNITPALHPMLAALYIVLHAKGDLSEISRNHPDLEQHKYFQWKAKFPNDISDLLPPCEDHWWEDLGK